MAVSCSTLATRMTAATAAAIATAIGGGTTADEVTALIKVLDVLGDRQDIAMHALKLANDVNLTIG